MKTIENEQTSSELTEYSYDTELSPWPTFASRMQLFAVIVYLLSHSFAVPLFAIGPSWAVWPRLDDFATLFLFIVYLCTRNNICQMDKNEHFISRLIVIGIILTLPSILIGKLVNPGAPKGMTFGIFQTYRVGEYFLVWFCIRGMIFSSKQFDKISYVVFFVVLFVAILCIGNITGAIPLARLASHLPQGPIAGHWTYLQKKTGASLAMGPYAGSLTMRMTLLTMFLLACRKPSVIFRILLIAVIGGVLFFSEARAGMIGWALAITIFSCKSIKHLAAAILIILILFILAITFSGTVDVNIMEGAQHDIASIVAKDDSNIKLSGRIERWSMIASYIVSHPYVLILGVGWGFTGQIFEGNAHCMYLQILCEGGLGGLFMFLFLLFNVWHLLKGKNRLLAAMRAAFLAYLVTGLTGEVLYPTSSNESFLGCLGAIFAIAVAAHRGSFLESQYYSEFELTEAYVPQNVNPDDKEFIDV